MRVVPVAVLLFITTAFGCQRPEEPRPTNAGHRPSRADMDPPDASGGAAALEVAFEEAEHVVTQGRSLRVAVKLAFGDAAAPSVALSVRGLPRGLSSPPVTVTSKRAILEIRATDDAEQGPALAQLDAVRDGFRVTTAFPLFVRGPAGALDTTFGDGGTYEDPSDGSTAGTLVLGAEDSLFALRRCTWKVCVDHLTADGAPILTYGHDGVAWTGLDFPIARDLVAMREADGSLIVASESIDSVGVGIAKLGPDGAPVASFGTGEFGPGTMPVDLQGALAGLSPGPKGTFFVGGTERSGSDVWFGLRRFDAMGRPAAEFGDGGRVRAGLKTPWTGGVRDLGGHAWGIGALDERTHFVLGEGRFGSTLYYGICAISNTSGAPEAAFGTDGQQSYKFPVHQAIPFWTVGRHVAVTDGMIRAFVVWQDEDASTHYTLVALGADGRPIVGFGKDGLSAPIPVDDDAGSPIALAVDRQGRIVVVLGPTALAPAALVRFTKDGHPDPSFGHDGRVRIEGARSLIHADVAIQSDGRVVALTTKGDALEDHRTMLSRYWD